VRETGLHVFSVAFDYEKLRDENVKRFGTDIARVGKLLLEERYDERSHFILELLQNAEDALAKLPAGHSKNGRVVFSLEPHGLRLSHFWKAVR
jgi:hypothetical protein